MKRFLVVFVLALLGAGSGPAWAQTLREPISGFSIVKPEGWLVGTVHKPISPAEAQALWNLRRLGSALIFVRCDPKTYPRYAPRLAIRVLPPQGSKVALDDWRSHRMDVFLDMRNATLARGIKAGVLAKRYALNFRVHRKQNQGGQSHTIVEDYWIVPSSKGTLVVTTMRLANDANDPRAEFRALLNTASWTAPN